MIYKNKKRQYWQELKYHIIRYLLRKLTRVEIIGDSVCTDNKLFVKYGTFEVSIQDNFKTLKIFIK